ncbi:PKD domain-containing protein [Arthrobacter humicola]
MIFLLGTALVGVGSARADSTPADPANPATPATVTADALPTVQIDGVVWQQAIVGNTVYAVGNFSSARPAGAAPGTQTVPRSNMLAYNLTTGVLDTTFAPVLNAQALTVAVSPDGSRVYVGGSFTTVNGATAYRVAALYPAGSPNAGQMIPSFQPYVDSRVNAIVATDTAVYLGGWFNAVGTQARSKLGAVSPSTGAPLAWAPVAANGNVSAMVLTPDKSKIITGGNFTTLNGSSNPGYGLGAVDLDSGASLPWAANSVVRNAGANASITSLTADGENVYGTGYVFGSGGNLEGTFSARGTDGTLNWIEDCHGDTYGAAPVGDVIYTVSHAHYCGNIGAFPQPDPWVFHPGMAFSKSATGIITRDPLSYFNFAGNPRPSLQTWFPDLASGTFTGQSQAAWAVAGNSNYVVMGGEFPSVNGTAQQGLVRFAAKPLAPNAQGPMVAGGAFNPRLQSPASGTALVTWKANWDRDNENLTYKVIRNGDVNRPVYSVTRPSTFWNRPSMSFVDTNLTPGATYGYRIFAVDPAGREVRSETVNVTIASTGTLSSYANRVLTDEATDYWRLGEPSGAARDWTGVFDATIGAGVTRGQTGGITGDADSAASFNGTTTGIASTATAFPAPDTFTLEAWVKTTSPAGGKIIGFGNRSTGNSTNYDRHVYMDNLGRLFFGVRQSGFTTVNTTERYNDGQWHHVVASLGAGGMELYVDGTQQAQRTDVTRGQANNGYWRIGGDNLASWPSRPLSGYLNGTLDDVAVYPTVLSAETVAAHHALGTSGTAPNVAPTASFTATASALTASVDGTASTDPDGTITGHTWEFGDGGTATGATAQHTYATAGTYTIKLTVTDNTGATGTTTKTVTVAPANVAPTASFTATASALTASVDGTASTDPDGTITGHAWEFGDGGTATGATAQHTYATAGTYTIKLTVTDNTGATGTTTKTVTVAPANVAPTASFTATASALTASVDGTASTDPDGTITGHAWEFGDGGTATGATAQHTYATAGTYTIKLTVTDNTGATGTTTKTVTVAPANVAPTASFTATASALTASVDGTASTDPDGTITGHAWEFGDGGTATGATAQHTYATAGTYTIKLTVTDNTGATGTTTKTVTVAPANVAPTASFTATASALTASVDGTASTDPDGTITGHAWEFGDGGTATGATAQHTYATAGTYTIKLTVTDNTGATGTTTKTVTVNAVQIFAQDKFERTVASGFGLAEVGGNWSTWGSSGTTLSVAGGQARVTTSNAAGSSTATLGSVSISDADLQMKISLDKLTNGGGTFITAVGRNRGTSGEYRAKIWISQTGAVNVQAVRAAGGTETTLASQTVPGLTYAAGDQLQLRFQVTGLAPTTLNAKIWKVGSSEPTAWLLTTQDSTAALQGTGSIGLATYLSGTATNAPVVIRFDDLIVAATK